MKSTKALGLAILFATLSTGPLANSSGNGADGWHKLQTPQITTRIEPQTDHSRASTEDYAEQAIADNPSNYNVH